MKKSAKLPGKFQYPAPVAEVALLTAPTSLPYMVQQLRLIESYKAHSGVAGMPACTHSIPTARLDSKGVLTTACSTARSSTLDAAVGLLAGGYKCRFMISLAFSLVKACAAVRRPQLALIMLVSSVPAIICKWVCSCGNWPLVHSLGDN